MRVAITGGTGLVGRFMVDAARAAGYEVILPRFRLGDAVAIDADALIHCAFAHAPGKYRGGEGDDPEGFRRANVDGTLRLFDGFRGRTVFLSTRAVYGDYPAGTVLREDMPPRPDTLYGQVKAEVELHATVSLRATGVYGPGPGHKWESLFADHLAGRPIAPRVATEVHGDDLAQAALIALDRGEGAYNVSDLLLDRHDLLAELGGTPPARSDAKVSEMDCTRLRDIGWRPGGWERLRASLPAMLQSVPSR
ncbi:NAD-dependent epimerase/dehydratase family protein [Falsirhodobacter xinxiangensis]|uniref:NAD-dependent epimerase/dehydratase family protein n=1 Tax=Falsirhodobacter xinxiangensis TaxID=2530049 RepID=UPI0010AAFF67|nr:NAD(P)-dependent oxidoreductase [Rhodobacter xinxiangensis]